MPLFSQPFPNGNDTDLGNMCTVQNRGEGRLQAEMPVHSLSRIFLQVLISQKFIAIKMNVHPWPVTQKAE